MFWRKRGLQSVPSSDVRAGAESHPLAQQKARDDAAFLVLLKRIRPDPLQPRRDFDDEGLQELVTSIEEHGILQPLLLHQKDGFYQIVAGERRFRAAQLAGLRDVPARLYTGEERVREAQLVENLQREELSLLDEAHALSELRDRLDATIRGLEEATGKSKSYIARRSKILELPDDVQAMLAKEPRLLSKADEEDQRPRAA